MEGRICQILLIGDAISFSGVATPSTENPSQLGWAGGWDSTGCDTGESESSGASERAGEAPDKETTSKTKTCLAMR